MTPTRDTYCSACGTAFAPPLAYPRTCAACGLQVWANPTPVAVVLAPLRLDRREGLLVVRRAIPPQIGKLALVGGFVEDHETWQEAGAREVREEAGVAIDARAIEPFWFTSTEPRPNRVLLFGVAPAIDASALPPFEANREASERGVVFGPAGLDEVFAFPLHAEAARRYFAARGAPGPHEYRAT
jgi:ADP-ribose pyrophosphatase YjhB (NUDIX family)